MDKTIITPRFKIHKSPDYNYIFRRIDGEFIRWGKTLADDPQQAPFPEILDIEVTTKCEGIPDKFTGITKPCKFCYKSNTANGKNMSLKTFKEILLKFDRGLTQIAFGADATATNNPDLFDMMRFTIEQDVVPNITVANITDETAEILSELCGAVAVSRYENKDICYDSVRRLTDCGMNQVNIHMMISEQTYDDALETIYDIQHDSRLAKLNAIVFLSLKQTGRGKNFTILSKNKFKTIIKTCRDNNVSFGMDSCSAPKFLDIIRNTKYAKYERFVEPCESTLFSAYINVDGEFFPCSFAEMLIGINVLEHDTFDTVWNATPANNFRQALLRNDRKCWLHTI